MRAKNLIYNFRPWTWEMVDDRTSLEKFENYHNNFRINLSNLSQFVYNRYLYLWIHISWLVITVIWLFLGKLKLEIELGNWERWVSQSTKNTGMKMIMLTSQRTNTNWIGRILQLIAKQKNLTWQPAGCCVMLLGNKWPENFNCVQPPHVLTWVIWKEVVLKICPLFTQI